MKLTHIIAGLLLAGAAATASAQSNGAADTTQVGKVETVYVREAKGLYIEKKLLRETAGREIWVDARLASEVGSGSTGELFQVPAELAIERGDLVATRIGDTAPRVMNLLPVENQVTRLVAKHDTLMAMTFGLGNSRRAQGFYTDTQACWAPTPLAYAGIISK